MLRTEICNDTADKDQYIIQFKFTQNIEINYIDYIFVTFKYISVRKIETRTLL
jgi:hypothetical protein